MWAIRLSDKAPRTQEEAETLRQRAEALSQTVRVPAALPCCACHCLGHGDFAYRWGSGVGRLGRWKEQSRGMTVAG